MKLAVIGTGYVGLVQAAGLAELNNKVIAIDHDRSKIEKLNSGEIPFHEEGLESLVTRNVKEGRLEFSTTIDGINGSEAIFICVGTPPLPGGKPDLAYVEKVAQQIGKSLNHYSVVVEKSTVPVRTAEWMEQILRDKLKTDFDVAVNPEFLREGTAIYDFFNPDRIVIGSNNPRADAILTEIYKPLKALTLHTDMKSAELIKHGSNAFLSMKISYANMLSRICEKSGADIDAVTKGIGLDRRIGKEFLNAGLGYGGFCFPKDLDAFIATLEDYCVDASLLKAVREINDTQVQCFADKINKALNGLEGKTIAVLGLAFKPGTDDMRLAQSIQLIERLQSYGAAIRAYDPKSMENAKKIESFKNVYFASDKYDAVNGSNAVAIVTEWKEFTDLDFYEVKKHTNHIFDGRNIFSLERMKTSGFKYFSVGRKPVL